MDTKFQKRMTELSADLKKSGKNSKLHNAIQEKMLNINKPLNKWKQ